LGQSSDDVRLRKEKDLKEEKISEKQKQNIPIESNESSTRWPTLEVLGDSDIGDAMTVKCKQKISPSSTLADGKMLRHHKPQTNMFNVISKFNFQLPTSINVSPTTLPRR